MDRIPEKIKARLIGGPGTISVLGGSVKRFYKLRAAYSIAMEISSSLDLEEALKIFVNRVASYMDVEIVSVMFLDNEKSRLIVKIARGLSEEVITLVARERGRHDRHKVRLLPLRRTEDVGVDAERLADVGVLNPVDVIVRLDEDEVEAFKVWVLGDAARKAERRRLAELPNSSV